MSDDQGDEARIASNHEHDLVERRRIVKENMVAYLVYHPEGGATAAAELKEIVTEVEQQTAADMTTTTPTTTPTTNSSHHIVLGDDASIAPDHESLNTIQEVLQGFPKEDRNQFLNFCFNQRSMSGLNGLADNCTIVDNIILTSLGVRLGSMDMYGHSNSMEGIDAYYNITHNTDIDDLDLQSRTGTKNDEPVAIPNDIIHLGTLRELLIRGSIVLGNALTNLRHLESLTFDNCDLSISIPSGCITLPSVERMSINNCELSGSFPDSKNHNAGLLNLPRLKTLDFRGKCSMPQSNGSSIFTTLLTGAALEELDFGCTNDLGDIIDYFCQQDQAIFGGSVKTIEFSQNGVNSVNSVNNKQLETLLFNVFPTKFPNLESVVFKKRGGFNDNNGIQSFKSISDTINNCEIDTVQRLPSSLCTLCLDGNPVLNNIQSDPDEKEAFLNFLKFNNSIYCLRERTAGSYGDDVDYELLVNHAGRRHVNQLTPLFVKVLPFYVARSYDESYKIHEHPDAWIRRDARIDDADDNPRRLDASGVFYLLRELVSEIFPDPKA